MESIRSMKDGASYTLLKDTENEQANQLVQSYYKKPKEVLVLIDSRDYEQIERFTDYSFSKNEEKILLESDDLPIYRRSKIA
jgi:dipeptidyl-peptidase-4